MKKKFFIFFTSILLLPPLCLSAQTAAELEKILETESITCAQAAMFVYSSSGMSVGTDSADTAFEQAVVNGWLSGRTSPDEYITLGKLSFLMMRAFGIKGSVMYAIFPGPRYAYRSMVSRNFIQGASDPSMKVSGSRFLIILGKVLNEQGG